MGEIQNTLNQLLTLSAVGVRTSDAYQRNTQVRQLKKESNNLEKIAQSQSKDIIAAGDDATEQQKEAYDEVLRKQIAVNENIAEIKPTKKNIENKDDLIFDYEQDANAGPQRQLDKELNFQKREKEKKLLQEQLNAIEESQASRLVVPERIKLLREQEKENLISKLEGLK